MKFLVDKVKTPCTVPQKLMLVLTSPNSHNLEIICLCWGDSKVNYVRYVLLPVATKIYSFWCRYSAAKTYLGVPQLGEFEHKIAHRKKSV